VGLTNVFYGLLNGCECRRGQGSHVVAEVPAKHGVDLSPSDATSSKFTVDTWRKTAMGPVLKQEQVSEVSEVIDLLSTYVKELLSSVIKSAATTKFEYEALPTYDCFVENLSGC
jgi:hypothetical protein